MNPERGAQNSEHRTISSQLSTKFSSFKTEVEPRRHPCTQGLCIFWLMTVSSQKNVRLKNPFNSLIFNSQFGAGVPLTGRDVIEK